MTAAGAAPPPGRDDAARPPAAIAVTRLALADVRSYARLKLELGPGPVVLTGPNGAGKTNLLEAVSFLSPGRGLRGAALADVARRPQMGPVGAGPTSTGPEVDAPSGGWSITAIVGPPEDRREVTTGLAPGETRRMVRLDGRPASSQSALAGVAPMLWLTPAMDRVFAEGASGRRRFLDRLVLAVQPDHAAQVARYERAMRERARLLAGPAPDRTWLSAIEETMAAAGVAIAAARRETALRLASAPAIAGFPPAVLSVAGRLEAALGAAPAVDVEEAFRRELCDNRRVDAAGGMTTVGPHRSDLVVRHGAKDMPASQCSTGEQKALLIGIVTAHARLLASEQGRSPILLLDEVAAHLDGDRRAALYEGILALGAQAWMTGTEAALFAPLRGRARHLHVAGGRVAEDEWTRNDG